MAVFDNGVWQVVYLAGPMDYLLSGLAAVAVLICCWMTFKSTGLVGLPGCNDKSDCDAVATSRWSRWASLPVAAVATGVYLTLAIVFGIAGVVYQGHPVPISLYWAVFFLILLVVEATVWFLILEVAVLRKRCAYCNLVHALGLSIAVIWFASSAHRQEALRDAGQVGLGSGIGLLLLVGGQVFWKPPQYAVLPSKVDQKSGAGDLNLPFQEERRGEGVSVKSCNGTRQETISHFLSDKIRLQADGFPSIGPRDATRCVALVFDYTCTSCRRLHRFVDELVGVRRDTRAMFLPVPKNPACNPAIKEIRPGRGQACQYARLAIGVWKKRPDQYLHFGQYLCSAEELPPLGLARECAEELAGASIDPHVADEEIEKVILESVRVYQSIEIEKVPVLLLSNSSFLGKVDTFEEFKALIEPQLLGGQSKLVGAY